MGLGSCGFLVRKKKALVWLAAAISAGAMIGLAYAYQPRIYSFAYSILARKTGGTAATSNRPADQADLMKDDDGDGLKNWEEVIWKTDPQKPDTDGDGLKDGDEVAAGRNSLAADGTGTAENQPKADLPGGATSELAQAIIESGALETAAKGGSPNLPAEYIDRIRNSYADNEKRFVEGKKAETRYAETAGTSTIKAYFEKIAELYLNEYSKFEKSDLVIVAEALEKDRLDLLSQIDPLINAGDRIWTQIVNNPVPASARDYHEKFATLHLRGIFQDITLRNLEKDPTSALLAMRKRAADRFELTQFLDIEVKRFLEAKGVAFGENEAGRQMFNW